MKNRIVNIIVNGEDQKYELYSIEWVKNKEVVKQGVIKRIDAQHIILVIQRIWDSNPCN